MTVREFKEKVYEEYKAEIDLISENSKKDGWQADIGVATDMFLSSVEANPANPFLKVGTAERIAELRSAIED